MTEAGSRILHQAPDIRLEGDVLVFPDLRIEHARITHVHVDQIASAATGPIVMSAVGLVCLLSMGGEGGGFRAAAGAILLGAAGVWWSQKKPTFRLVLRTEDEEFSAFEDRSEQLVEAIRTAVSEVAAL